MTAYKPAVVIVMGGFHIPAHYQLLKVKLEAQGYETFVPNLPSGNGQPGITWKDDVAAIHATVEPYMDQGKEFVVVCHSYGGIPGCAATEGYTVEERERKGKKGGFRAILFIASFAAPRAGLDLLQCLDGQHPAWMTAQAHYQKNLSCCVNEKAKHAFYNDMPDDEAQRCFDILVPTSQDSFETPVEFVATDLTIPRTFLICENDQALPLAKQEFLSTATPGMKVARCSAGHSPFLSQPDRVVEVIAGL